MSDFSEPHLPHPPGDSELDAARDLDAWIERHVFEDDLTANTDERRRSCMIDVVSAYSGASGGKMGLVVAVRLPLGGWTRVEVLPYENPDRRGIWSHEYVWNNRIGTEYQSALQTHVANWRAEPRPFTSDYRLCFEVLVPKMCGRGWYVDCGLFRNGIWWAEWKPLESPVERSESVPLAICRAAKAAVEAREGVGA